MAFSRNSMVAAVAGTLSLAVLTGCPAQTPGGTGTPSVPPTTAPTGAPTATTAPTTAPTGQPTDGTTPTAAPSVTPSASTLAPTTVQGKVYAEDGALISSGAKVMIKSLNPSNPFETTIDVVNGNYVANNVPAGVLVEIVAMRDNWTSRTQVATLLPLNTASQGNVVDFGGGTNPYFISKYPEISMVEPGDETTLADSSQLTYKLTLSEPLNSDNRNRFAASLRVWPANSYASTNYVGNLNLDTANLSGSTTNTTAATFAAGGAGAFDAQTPAREGTPFLTASNVASVTWDAAGKVATFSFKAPLKASKDGKARYAVGLSAANLTSPIQDSENNNLGQAANATETSSTFADYSNGTSAGDLFIANAFKKPDLPTLSGSGITAARRWAETHDNVAEFDVAEDKTAPTLATVTVTGRNVFTLTFSEPMVAAAGSTVSSSTSDTTRYYFQIADTESELGTDAAIKNANSANAVTSLANAATEETVYTFDNSAFEAVPDENDPKIVRIRRKGIVADPNGAAANDRLDATKVKYVRVKVLSSVTDPAGNALSTSNEAALKTVTL